MITVEIRGLRVFGHHGVYEEERAQGQDFLFDLELEVGDRGASDLESASVGAAVAAYERGATIVRAHDVAPHVDALNVAKAFA